MNQEFRIQTMANQAEDMHQQHQSYVGSDLYGQN